jgi:rhodanese-related sulfurtransferase
MNRGRTIRQVALLVAIAAVLALVSNALAGPERRLKWVGAYTERPAGAAGSGASAAVSGGSTATGSPEAPATSAASGREFPPHPEKPWVEIPYEDVAALYARGNVPFLDARRSSVYRQGHIARARAFPVWEADIDERVKALALEGLDTSAPIVVYCSGGDCEDSHMLAEKLHMVGFDNVLVYKDGFPDWQKRGGAQSTGENP